MFFCKFQQEGKIENMVLIDFQLFGLYCPVHDLVYAFYPGATGSTLDKFEQYLQLYYESLSNTLQELNLDAGKIYTFSTLKEDWKDYAKFGFFLALLVWRMKLARSEDLIDYAEIDHENPREIRLTEEKENTYREIVRNLVLHMYNNNFF